MTESQIEQVREMLRGSGGAIELTVEQSRESLDAMTAMLPVPEGVSVEAQTGDVTGDWLSVPGTRAGRFILYFHGGAYNAGGPHTHRSLAGQLCVSAEAQAFVARYRLAPENPFPAAVEDAVAAYRWMLTSPRLAEYGEHAADHIIVAGDSAGGGLSVAMLVSARDQGLPMPGGVVCMSPWADLSCSGPGYGAREECDPIIDGDNVAKNANIYLNGVDPKTPLASPAFADLTALPEMLIQVGADEVLMGDSLLLEAQAHRAGVPATLEIWARMVHVWQAFYPLLSEGLDAIERIAAFCDKRWPDA